MSNRTIEQARESASGIVRTYLEEVKPQGLCLFEQIASTAWEAGRVARALKKSATKALGPTYMTIPTRVSEIASAYAYHATRNRVVEGDVEDLELLVDKVIDPSTFVRTAVAMFAGVTGKGAALAGVDYVTCTVAAIAYEPDYSSGNAVPIIDECRDGQTYEIRLVANGGPELVDLTLRVHGYEGLRRYRFGSEVRVCIAPKEADPAASVIADYLAIEDGDVDSVLTRETTKALEGITDERVRSYLRAALRVADEVTTR
jgi:hypothetical protein